VYRSSKNRNDEPQGDEGEGLFKRDSSSNDNNISKYTAWYTVEGWGGSMSSDAGMITYELPGRGLSGAAPYWILPSQTNGALEATYADLTESSVSAYFTNNAPSISIKLINFPKIVKNIRVLGLMAIISYMVVILFTWMCANFSGYVYFSAGEPMLFIKYPEWALGFIGIFVAIDSLRKELDEGALW